ncbi:MAG: hypothetical protein LBI13_06670 [Streptococcaceae bacterium]|jgi:predicted small secreted protein|nr:hypothetical protein [Streptococcaceae bacterium]
MKKLIAIVLLVLMGVTLTACATNKSTAPDYSSAAKFEQALNNHTDVTGKTVEFTVNEYITGGFLPYNIHAGDHLNFGSNLKPKEDIKVGQTLEVKVLGASGSGGIWIINYTDLKVVEK